MSPATAEPIELEHEKLFLRLDRGIFELFEFPPTTDFHFRTPVRWLAVQFDARRADRCRLRFGFVEADDVPLFGTQPVPFVFTHTPSAVLPQAAEGVFREYFARVAKAAGRRLGA
ncbi:hypothetical protein ACIPY5_09710 [Microbacterium sp. NPDC089698]|uniref:hypothetical protein n=1 Tax=Microbacterium sp. NPDC089698 TaxID=3364200 RepID=UPI00381FB326